MDASLRKTAEPRAHHFAPQCWLAGFTDTGRKDGRLFVTDLKRRKQWPSSPPNAGHQRDLYRISEDALDPVAFERVFSQMEDVVAPVFRSMYDKPREPSVDELERLLSFAALQYIRVPAFRPVLLKIADSIHRSVISGALKTPAAWAAALKKAKIPLDSPGAESGSNLASASQQSTSNSYPTQLADVQVTVGDSAVPLQYVSPSQINAVFSATGLPTPSSTGLLQVTVSNGSGVAVTNVLLAPAVPEIFSLDSTGSGAAAAINGLTGAVVSPTNPLHKSEYLTLFLTGLGATTTQNGLEYARIQPTITVGSQVCGVTYAGRAPTIPGVDQINCVIPSGVSGSALPVSVISGGRASNTVTIAVQ